MIKNCGSASGLASIKKQRRRRGGGKKEKINHFAETV